MRKPILLISIFIITSIGVAKTIDEEIGGAEKYIEKYIPKAFSSYFDDYLEMIGIKSISSRGISSVNKGLVNYSAAIKNKNPCFERLHDLFTKKNQQKSASYSNKKKSLLTHPNTLEATTKNTNVESGWYWDLAQKLTQNDNNLSMLLVGLCGHDDVRNGCQSNSRKSAWFRQGSLGAETILNPSTIKTISDIQAPTKGPSALPAKYYHTIGAAYVTCSLVRQGIPGFAISRIQSAAANTYRMFRLCNRTKFSKAGYSAHRVLKNLTQKGWGIKDIMNGLYPKKNNNQHPPLTFNDEIRYDLESLKNDLKRYGVPLGHSQSKIFIRKKISIALSFIDARKLFLEKVVANGTCRTPQIRKSRIKKIRAIAQSKKNICKDLPDDRCDRAKKRLHTWWADFHWTEALHLKGAEFAINKCKKEPNFLKEINKRSCAALKKYHTLKKINPERSDSDL